MKKQLILLGLGLLMASSVHANLIVNGSFENHPAFSGTWGLFSSIPGWTPEGNVPIELGTPATYGVTGADGNTVMELDSTANVTVDQGITGGAIYTLSFLYAERSGISPSSCMFDVYWNGNLVISAQPTSTAMSLFSTTVTGNGGVNTLKFVGAGTSDSYGALIDNVQLNSAAVPEPSTWVAGALMVLPFGIQGLRAFRMRKQRA